MSHHESAPAAAQAAARNQPGAGPRQPDHRTRILDAAHRCFVRSGFHRATMQDVAAEAGMSAGNLYRYFASKDAIVSGLSERDRTEMTAAFGSLSDAADPFAMFLALGRQHLVDEPREKAIFVVDLWAEAARNPKLAGICADCDNDIRAWIAGFLNDVVASGEADPRLDIGGVVELLMCIADGILARRAREPDFDASGHMNQLASLLRLACAGKLPNLLRAEPAAAPSPSGELP